MITAKQFTPKQALIVVIALNFVLFVSYGNTVRQMFAFWSASYGYSHGVLLFPILLGIYFYELYKTPRLNLSLINGLSLLCLVAAGFLWFVSDLLNIQFVEFLAFWGILVVFNLIITTNKFKNAWHLWPLLLIIFILPLWDFLPEILRTIETPMVVFALNASFIHAVQDGFLIYIPAGTFLVEHSCSGFNQFIVSIPLGVLYSYSRKLNPVTGFKFVLLLLLLAIFFNTLRIYIILVAGQLTHMKSALVVDDHEYLAWLIYGIGVFILFFIADRHLKPQKSVANTVTSPFMFSAAQLRRLLLLGVILAMGPLFSVTYPAIKNNTLVDIQHLVGKLYWKEVEEPISFKPAFVAGERVYLHKLENLFAQDVVLYLNYFVNQEQGREAISNLNSLVNRDSGERLLAEKLYTLTLPEERHLTVNEFVVLQKSGRQYLVWQWYYTNGEHVYNTMDARLNHLQGILHNKPAISNIVLFKQLSRGNRMMASQTKKEQVRKIMTSFVADNLAVLTAELR